MNSSDAVFVLRLCCGALLLWAGLQKLVDLGATRETIVGYRVVPSRLIGAAVVLLPVAEFGTGVLLITNLVSVVAAAIALVIFTVFAGGIASTVARGIRTACGCFSSSPLESTSLLTLARAVALAIMSALVAVASSREMLHVPASRLVPDVTVAVGAAVLLRMIGLVPQGLSHMREKPVVEPARGHRVSLRHLQLEPPPPLLPTALEVGVGDGHELRWD